MNNVETDSMLEKVRQVKNKFDNDGQLSKPATRYFKYNERVARENEVKQIEKVLSQPDWVRSGLDDEGRQKLTRRSRIIKNDLVNYSPPTDLSGTIKDSLYRRQQDLEVKIKNGMPPYEVMRRNPVGAVDRHRKWQSRNKDNILEWKNIRRVLNPDSDDKDLANVEQLRSSMMPNNGTTYMPDAQIPGHMAYTNVSQENWNNTFGKPKADTVLKQAERRETEELQPESIEKKVNAVEPLPIGAGIFGSSLQKDKAILELLDRNYTLNQIMQELPVQLRRIKRVMREKRAEVRSKKKVDSTIVEQDNL